MKRKWAGSKCSLLLCLPRSGSADEDRAVVIVERQRQFLCPVPRATQQHRNPVHRNMETPMSVKASPFSFLPRYPPALSGYSSTCTHRIERICCVRTSQAAGRFDEYLTDASLSARRKRSGRVEEVKKRKANDTHTQKTTLLFVANAPCWMACGGTDSRCGWRYSCVPGTCVAIVDVVVVPVLARVSSVPPSSRCRPPWTHADYPI